jgi:hypothetical protein
MFVGLTELSDWVVKPTRNCQIKTKIADAARLH